MKFPQYYRKHSGAFINEIKGAAYDQQTVGCTGCKAIFFSFLVYGLSDPNFCILEKKIYIYIFDFFYFL